MTTETRQAGSAWIFFLIFSGYLILTFLYRVFVPGGGWPLSPWHYISMGLTALLIAGLVAQRSIVSGALQTDDPRHRWIGSLFWCGLIAGGGSLLIRFTSDAAWWTGHLNN